MPQQGQPINTLLTTWLDLLDFTWEKGFEAGLNRLGFYLGLSLIVLYLYRRLDVYAPAKALWAYCLLRAIWLVEFPTTHFGVETLAFQADAGANLAEVILLPAFVLLLSEGARAWVWRAMPYFMLWPIACAWLRWNGPQIAPSFNLALVALYLPLAPRWFYFAAVPSILSHHAGTAQLMLATQAFVWAVRSLPWRWAVGAGVALPGIILPVIYYHSHGPMLDMLGRLERWSVTGPYMRSWLFADHTGKTTHLDPVNVLFGVGPATFSRISIKINNFESPMVLFLHNEFQQVPWELGVVALILALAVYARAARSAWGDLPLLCSLASLLPLAFFWHPFRFFVSATLALLILHRALFPKKLWDWPIQRDFLT